MARVLKILNVAYPLAPVRPATAGGAEQVVAMLDRALTAAGHHSFVVACEGSQVTGTLIAANRPAGPLTNSVAHKARDAYRHIVAEAVQRHQPDVIHLHGIDFLSYLPPEGIPAVATLHLPPSWYPPAVFSLERPKTWLHCVSSAQRRDCPESAILLSTVENGVPDNSFARPIRKQGYAVTMGRICPEKGTDTAIRAAKAAGIPILIAGEVFPYEAHLRYFAEQVKPLLNHQCARFIGSVGPRAKRRLLSAAKCVLIPSNVAETSSLVAMEAAMCGTPVIAFAMGALSEIVEDGKTGFLVSTEKEMAEAIQNCSAISPSDCRKVALERFSEQKTQSKYLEMYQTVAQ